MCRMDYHAVACGPGFRAATVYGVVGCVVTSGSLCVGSALLAYARVPGSLSLFLLLVSTGSSAAFALLGGVVAGRRRFRREGRNTPGQRRLACRDLRNNLFSTRCPLRYRDPETL